MAITARKAVREDLSDVLDLLMLFSRAIEKKTPFYIRFPDRPSARSWFLDALTSKKFLCVVGEDSGSIVGVSVYQRHRLWKPKRVERPILVEAVWWVKKGFRGQGVGREMMRFVRGRLSKLNVGELYLMFDSKRTPADIEDRHGDAAYTRKKQWLDEDAV